MKQSVNLSNSRYNVDGYENNGNNYCYNDKNDKNNQLNMIKRSLELSVAGNRTRKLNYKTG